MALPVTIPNQFANATASIPLSQLDSNFNTLANAVNGIADGSESLSNVSITGGTVNVSALVSTANVSVGDDLIFTGTGNRITGDFSNATIANRVMFQNSVTNSATVLPILPNGTSTQSQFEAHNNSDPTNCAKAQLLCGTNESRVASAINGSGTYLPMTFYTGGSERMRIDTSGNVLVGTTTFHPSYTTRLTLSVNSGTTNWAVGPFSATPAQFVISGQNGGGVYLNGTAATSWTAISDERSKENLKPIENAAAKVLTLRAVTGNYKLDTEKTSRAFLIAQDVLEVLPEAVDTTNSERYGIAYTDVIPLLVAAIKELKAELDTVKAELATLKGQA